EDAGCEIIFVDDASPNPKTWETLLDIQRSHRNVKIIQLSKNFGQQAATLCGIEVSKGDFIITMDDDLQQLPEDITELIKEQDHDVVIAQFEKRRHSRFVTITSRIKGWFEYKLIQKPKHIQMSSFRLIKRNTIDAFDFSSSPYPFISATLFSITNDIVGVTARHNREFEGKSNYNFIKRFKLFTNLIINNSSFLLRMIGSLGIILSVVAFLIALWLIYRKVFLGVGLIGWTSTIVAVLFIGGLLLFSVGVTGEYLVRIIGTIEKKPSYHKRYFIE
ncbi:MAG: glycosyltransferase, partial [Candidatus Sulfobium sp.]